MLGRAMCTKGQDIELPPTYLQETEERLCHLCHHQVDLEVADLAGADRAEADL